MNEEQNKYYIDFDKRAIETREALYTRDLIKQDEPLKTNNLIMTGAYPEIITEKFMSHFNNDKNPQQEYMDRAAGFSYFEEQVIGNQTGSMKPYDRTLVKETDPLHVMIKQEPHMRFLTKKDGSKVLQCAVQVHYSDFSSGVDWVDVPEVEE